MIEVGNETTETVETTENTEAADNTEIKVNPLIAHSNQKEDIVDKNFVIPEEYKNKKYLEGVNNMDALLKKLDGAESLIGKKMDQLLPNENSTEEEWNAHWNKLGRPESSDKYKFDKVEMPEGIKIDEEIPKEAKEVMHKLGLTNKQANEMQKWFDTKSLGIIQNHKMNIEKQDKEFKDQFTKMYGDESEKVINIASKLIKENVPAEFKNKLDSISNDNLIILSGVLKNINDKYIKEDTLINNKDISLGTSKTEKRSEILDLLASDEATNMMNPKYKEAQEKIHNYYNRKRG